MSKPVLQQHPAGAALSSTRKAENEGVLFNHLNEGLNEDDIKDVDVSRITGLVDARGDEVTGDIEGGRLWDGASFKVMGEMMSMLFKHGFEVSMKNDMLDGDEAGAVPLESYVVCPPYYDTDEEPYTIENSVWGICIVRPFIVLNWIEAPMSSNRIIKGHERVAIAGRGNLDCHTFKWDTLPPATSPIGSIPTGLQQFYVHSIWWRKFRRS